MAYNDTYRQCFYCEGEFNKAHYGTNKPLAQTRDHIIPLSKGGSNRPANMVYACTCCNHFKASLTLEEFVELVTGYIENDKTYKSIPQSRLHLIVKKATLLIDYVKQKGKELYQFQTSSGEPTAYHLFPKFTYSEATKRKKQKNHQTLNTTISIYRTKRLNSSGLPKNTGLLLQNY
jgi:hypothetical protein